LTKDGCRGLIDPLHSRKELTQENGIRKGKFLKCSKGSSFFRSKFDPATGVRVFLPKEEEKNRKKGNKNLKKVLRDTVGFPLQKKHRKKKR